MSDPVLDGMALLKARYPVADAPVVVHRNPHLWMQLYCAERLEEIATLLGGS